MSCVACHDRSCVLCGNVEFFFLGMKGWGGIDGRTEEDADGPDSECDMSGGKEAVKGGTAEHPMKSVCGWGDAVHTWIRSHFDRNTWSCMLSCTSQHALTAGPKHSIISLCYLVDHSVPVSRLCTMEPYLTPKKQTFASLHAYIFFFFVCYVQVYKSFSTII